MERSSRQDKYLIISYVRVDDEITKDLILVSTEISVVVSSDMTLAWSTLRGDTCT